MGRPPYEVRVLNVPWCQDLATSDLVPMDWPIYTRNLHLRGQAERHMALQVIGTFGISLGLVAIRCLRSGGTLTPDTLSIPDEPVEIELHSNPRRATDDDGA